MTSGHGEPIQKLFAFEDREHVVGVLCHDPRCLPKPAPVGPARKGSVQGFLGGDLAESNGNGNGTANGHANGDGGGSSLPPPPYGVVLTAGGKVLRFALANLATISTRKGRSVVRLDPGIPDDAVVGVAATDGSENLCLATRTARVLIFPIEEANVVAGVAKGVTAIRLDAKDRVIGFTLVDRDRKRDGLRVRTNRGATQIITVSKYPVTGRGGKGHAFMQRGSLDAVIADEVEPVPPVAEVEAAS